MTSFGLSDREKRKMKKDPKVAIDWNKATIEPVQDHEHRNWGYK